VEVEDTQDETMEKAKEKEEYYKKVIQHEASRSFLI